MAKDSNDSDNTHAPPRFPGTRPKPHDIKIYFDALVECIAKNRLSNTADGKLPSRVAHLTKYPEEMAADPAPLGRNPDDRDRREHEKEMSRRFERRKQNKEMDLKIAVAVREDETSLFTLISDSMRETNPGLRDTLRVAFKVSGAPGNFSGSKALAKIRADLAAQVAEGTYDKFYEEALRWQETNRLKEGCTPQEFSARTRTFVHYTNPFLRRPFQGNAIGKFIVETILPAAYSEAGDRILGDCEKEDCLSDPVEVERRCLQKVAKCQKASSKAVVAAHGTPQGLDPTRCAEIDDGTDERTHDTETNSLIATLKKTLSEMNAHAANFRPGSPRKNGGDRKPNGWKPNNKTEWCAYCPHDGKGCFVNPNFMPKADDPVYVRICAREGGKKRLEDRRDKAAKEMGIKAKSLPEAKPPPKVPGQASMPAPIEEEEEYEYDDEDDDLFANVVELGASVKMPMNVGVLNEAGSNALGEHDAPKVEMPHVDEAADGEGAGGGETPHEKMYWVVDDGTDASGVYHDFWPRILRGVLGNEFPKTGVFACGYEDQPSAIAKYDELVAAREEAEAKLKADEEEAPPVKLALPTLTASPEPNTPSEPVLPKGDSNLSPFEDKAAAVREARERPPVGDTPREALDRRIGPPHDAPPREGAGGGGQDAHRVVQRTPRRGRGRNASLDAERSGERRLAIAESREEEPKHRRTTGDPWYL
jgi:hypothetical protein